MTYDWFPVIDEYKCKENCFACFKFCPQKVYEKEKLKPIVKNPQYCIKGCDSCKKICPNGAITFATTKMVDVGGLMVGIVGLEAVFAKYKNNFPAAFEELKKLNYIPNKAEDIYKDALKKEFDNFKKTH